jgi:hypothetical protein
VQIRARLGAAAQRLIDDYCLLPDRYEEMRQFGFVRRGSEAKDPAALQPYCVRPDGDPIHSATWDPDADLESMVYLFERTATALGEHRESDAAKYLGTLAHFVEDSLSPPHSVSAEELGDPAMHEALERSPPAFAIERRTIPANGDGFIEAITDVLRRCYGGAEVNRRALPEMIRAVREKDTARLDAHRLRAAKLAAELLADSIVVFWRFSVEAR